MRYLVLLVLLAAACGGDSTPLQAPAGTDDASADAVAFDSSPVPDVVSETVDAAAETASSAPAESGPNAECVPGDQQCVGGPFGRAPQLCTDAGVWIEGGVVCELAPDASPDALVDAADGSNVDGAEASEDSPEEVRPPTIIVIRRDAATLQFCLENCSPPVNPTTCTIECAPGCVCETDRCTHACYP